MTSHCAHGAASVPAKGVGRGCARKLPLAASASGGTCAGPGEPEGLHPRDHVGQRQAPGVPAPVRVAASDQLSRSTGSAVRSLCGIVKLRLMAVFDAQHGGFTAGSSPASWGSID